MLLNILHAVMVVIVAVIVWEVVNFTYFLIGVTIPAIILPLVGLLILVAVVIYLLRLFGVNI